MSYLFPVSISATLEVTGRLPPLRSDATVQVVNQRQQWLNYVSDLIHSQLLPGDSRTGVYREVEYRIARNRMGAHCGYIISSASQLEQLTPRYLEVIEQECHGSELTAPLGFDCCRLGDFVPALYLDPQSEGEPEVPGDLLEDQGIYRDIHYVTEVVYRIIDQLYHQQDDQLPERQSE